LDSYELTEWFAWLDAKHHRDAHAHEQAKRDRALEDWVNEG
jgi:hypothetical protein